MASKKSEFIKSSPLTTLYENLRYALLKHNINLIACPPRKLKELICTKINPTPKDELAGVCTIPFRTDSNRLMEYIGMTRRKLKERIKEHIADIKFCRQSTALSRLSFNQNIAIDFDQAKIISPTSNYYASTIREAIEFLYKSNQVCNDAL